MLPSKIKPYPAFGSAITDMQYANDTNRSYRYGFNAKESDKESGLQDYGFRIYNPSIGKFLSVDPLSKSYPWYSPYQFAGNMPIIAIDLDGLEPRTMISGAHGGLTSPMITILSTVFGYSSTSLYNTYWSYYADSEQGKRWFKLTGNPNAVTAGNNVYHNTKNYNDEAWFELIVHEQSHREDIENNGLISFYANYGVDGLRGYENIPTEIKAFANEALAKQLLQYKDGVIMEILDNKKTRLKDKNIQLTYIGKSFRLEKIVNPQLEQVLKSNSEIEGKLKSCMDSDEKTKLESLLSLGQALQKNLEAEKGNLETEIAALKKENAVIKLEGNKSSSNGSN